MVGNHDEIPKDRTIQVNFESFHLGLGFSEPEDTVMSALSTAFKIKMEGTKAYKNQISGSILYIEVRDTACLPIEFITGYHASLSLGYRGNHTTETHATLAWQPAHEDHRGTCSKRNAKKDIRGAAKSLCYPTPFPAERTSLLDTSTCSTHKRPETAQQSAHELVDVCASWLVFCVFLCTTSML